MSAAGRAHVGAVDAASRMPRSEPHMLRRKCACGGETHGEAECALCRAKREGTLRRFGDRGGASDHVPPVVYDALNEQGAPLDVGTRFRMEARLGHDFSTVRVHTSALADRSARAVTARAFTVGDDVVFARGEYSHDRNGSGDLLAHELVHVMQNLHSSKTTSGGLRIGDANDPAEVAADAITARTAFSGAVSRASSFGPGGVLRRKPPTGVSDSAVEKIRQGQFKDVLFELNGMSMDAILARLRRIEPALLEGLMLHVNDAAPLGERSVQRLSAAIGAAYMSQTGVTTSRLDALDEAMNKAALPGDQRKAIKSTVPSLPGGAATRVHSYYNVPATLMLEKYSVSQALPVLDALGDAELRDTLMRVDKEVLRSLMLNSRMAEHLRVERLRQALYIAWISRYPLEPARFDVGGETDNPILRMSTGAKLAEGMRRSIPKLGGQLGARVRELLTPESIALMVVFTSAYVVSQTTPIGWVADVLVAGLIVATVLMLGPEVVEIVKELIKYADKASGATSDADFEEAGKHFATATTKAGVDIVVAILFHRAGKAANLKPTGPRSPGLFEVIKTNGQRLFTTPGELAPFAEAVTSDGMSVRIPLESVPDNVLMSEKYGGKKGGKGVLNPKDPAFKDQYMSQKEATARQPKKYEKMIAESKPWTSIEVFEALTERLAAIRRRTGIRRVDVLESVDPGKSSARVEGGTLASAKTDVAALRGKFYDGASAKALPESMKGQPGTETTSLEATSRLAENHAEAVALDNLARDLNGLTEAELAGKRVWVLVEQEPCSSCASGIGTDAIPGPLMQFSLAFKSMILEVHSQRTSTSYILKNGVRQ